MIRSHCHIYMFLAAAFFNFISIPVVAVRPHEDVGFYLFYLDSRRCANPILTERRITEDYMVDITTRNVLIFVSIYILLCILAVFNALFDEFNEKVKKKRSK